MKGGGIAELHIRASAWYEENGLGIKALHHAAADDFERAARLVEADGTPLHLRGEMTPVLNWLKSLPKSRLDARPRLWVIYAGVLQAVGRFSSLEKVFQAAEAALQKDEPDAYARNLLGGLASLRATLLFGQHEIESGIVMARRALDLVHPTNFVTRAAATWALGRGYLMKGDRVAVDRAFAEALEIAQTSKSAIISLLATTGLGPALGLGGRKGGGDSAVALARQGREAMEEAGGTFVKLGQLLSTRVDLIPLAAADEFAKLQERVPHADPAEIRRLLETELKRPITEVFAEFEWQPIAAASIAQVRLARLHSGETVVAKVQRPGVADTIEQDLTIMTRLARMPRFRLLLLET